MKSPVFRGGGRVFGPRPRSYNVRLNKKVKRLARASALSGKAGAGEITVVEDFSFEAPKTSAYINILSALQAESKKSVLVTADIEKEVYLSSRNLRKAQVVRVADLNTYDILNAGALILSESAVEKIKESMV